MSHPIVRASSLVLLTTLAEAAIWRPAAAQECPISGILELPDDQDRWECTITGVVSTLRASGVGREVYADPSGDGYVRPGLEVDVSGSGPIEAIVTLRETVKDDIKGGYELAITHEDSAVSSLRVGTLYRALLYEPDRYLLGLDYFVWGPNPEYAVLYDLDHDFDLRIILRRVTQTCSMWARVSGDVNDVFYGDVAYYNWAVDGVFVDPELMRMLGQMGIASDAASKGEDSFSAFLKREAGGTDNFALSLQDYKLDQEFDTLSESGDAVEALLGLGNAKDQEVVRQVVGMLNNQFALGTSGVIDKLPEKGGEEGAVTFELNKVTATVGAVAEGGRIPFELVPGTPSAASLLLAVDPARNLVYGTFLGDLYTKGAYTLATVPNSRQLHVHVEANFTALKGQTTCVKAMQPR